VELLVTKNIFLPAARSLSNVSGMPSINESPCYSMLYVLDFCQRREGGKWREGPHKVRVKVNHIKKARDREEVLAWDICAPSQTRKSSWNVRFYLRTLQMTPSQSKMKTSTLSSKSAGSVKRSTLACNWDNGAEDRAVVVAVERTVKAARGANAVTERAARNMVANGLIRMIFFFSIYRHTLKYCCFRKAEQL